MPSGVIRPDAFVQGSCEHLLKVTDRIKAIYGRGAPSVCSDWVSFMSQAPDTDDVQEWLKQINFGCHYLILRSLVCHAALMFY
jgi:hypothetical protein